MAARPPRWRAVMVPGQPACDTERNPRTGRRSPGPAGPCRAIGSADGRGVRTRGALMAISFRRRGSLGVATILIAAAVTAVAVNSTRAPADTGASCGVAYTIAWQTPSDSPPDFGATVTVTNNSPYPISGWTVSWTFTAGQSIVAGSGYSANLAEGASTTWGFHADYNGTSNPVPSITCAGPSQGSGSATLSGNLDPLGVNTAAWDTNFTDPAIASDLSSASTGLIRYPGGSDA